MSEKALVVGLGASGTAVARHLRDRGAKVVAIDDSPECAARDNAAELGVELVEKPDLAALAVLVSAAAVVVPSPGVPQHHPVFRLAAEAQVPVRGEVELAYRWTRHPMIAITGTNGKTTVTALTAAMLKASGVGTVAAGNIGLPLSDAVRRDVEVIVAEVSSFQLRWTDTFRPKVAVWLNAAEDHLDWHPDMASYIAAKARIWAHQTRDDFAVVNADDPVVSESAKTAPSRVLTFGLAPGSDFTVAGGRLRCPDGDIGALSELPRSLPHDVSNSLAASAAALLAGASMEGVRAALRTFQGLAHRLSLVGEFDGVAWYDDSKATNPHAALAAVRSFESVVLLAGGRNKGLDLSVLREGSDHLKAVVAFGEAQADIEAAFAGLRPVHRVSSIEDAVHVATELTHAGDVVLLAPGCASFDQYRSYGERGDDFARAARQFFHQDSIEGTDDVAH